MITYPTFVYEYHIYFKPSINVYEVLFPAFIEMKSHFDFVLQSSVSQKKLNFNYLSGKKCKSSKENIEKRLHKEDNFCSHIILKEKFLECYYLDKKILKDDEGTLIPILSPKNEINLQKILSSPILQPYIQKHEFVHVRIG
jgi:hypothetical protein